MTVHPDSSLFRSLLAEGMPPTMCKMMIEKNIGNDFNWWDTWISNVEENLYGSIRKYGVKNTKSLFNTAPSDTAIIVGSGRSYAHNANNRKRLRLLKELGVTVIAMDRTYKLLRDNGVMPDIVVNIDAQEVCCNFIGFDNELIPKTVINLTSSPRLFEKAAACSEKVYGYLTQNPFSIAHLFIYNEYGKEYVCLRGGVVVTCAGIDLAIKMGFGYIVGLGIDGTYLHPNEVKKDRPNARIEVVPVHNSELVVYTHEAFLSAIPHFEKLAEMHPHIRFINCSHAEGMSLKHWHHSAFEGLKFDELKDFNNTFINFARGGHGNGLDNHEPKVLNAVQNDMHGIGD